MPGGSRGFLEVLALTASATLPLFLLATLVPFSSLFSTLLWLAGLVLDLRTTWRLYRENPSDFRAWERNVLFTSLADRMGFLNAGLVFVLLIELPLALLPTSLLFAPIFLYVYRSDVDVVACFSASLCLFGLMHLHAALKNSRLGEGRGRRRHICISRTELIQEG